MSRRRLVTLAALALLAGAAAGVDGSAQVPAPPPSVQPGPEPAPSPLEPPYEPIRWRRSVAIGRPFGGRLVRGVRLPAAGPDFFTWDPVRRRAPNRGWRRYGTDYLIRLVLRVAGEQRAAFPDAPRVAIGDLSRPRGGDFGPRFGSVGHASHQNGLDVDVYYPRLDGLERRAESPAEIDRELSQDLVDRFIRAGVEYVFVGPRTGLTGPRRVVQPLRLHDDHMHVRIRPKRRSR